MQQIVANSYLMKYFRFVIVGDFEIERNSQSCAMYCTKSDTCLCTVEICATAWQNKPCKNCLPWPEAGCFSVTRLDKFSPIGQTFIIFGDQFLLGRLAILGQIYKLAQNLFILLWFLVTYRAIKVNHSNVGWRLIALLDQEVSDS